MKKLAIHLLSAFLVLLVSANANGQNKDLDKLLSYMEGEFSSAKQAKKDSSFFAIYLGMHRIWKNEYKNEGWFYVEQALMTKKDKPYRQRIYHVYQNGNVFMSDIYLMENPMEYVGDVEKVQKLNRSDLTLKEGCTVFLIKESRKLYEGATKENTCKSTLRGASFATSIVKIKPKEIYSWDKGLDAEGNQVWGAEKEGYRFKKIKKK
ncbi:MAG: hypothetical protein HKN75_05530 [Bacteroidia bacterium]|nr:hypothetical protein [Bacteroidia bacterium]